MAGETLDALSAAKQADLEPNDVRMRLRRAAMLLRTLFSLLDHQRMKK
ncbi:unnamed protein product [marine sediment metagenome]|uniref:Uncharacterized protein n=1 Tax=marine sediment metagenome TaxID=412755 RepID=X0VXB2_9ZZZZ